MRAAVFALATSLASATLLVDTRPAHACGCLSPPEVTAGSFAVNQQSEQIIFEVEPGWVTAHVLIKYAGDPASFAWIVPVPEIPELGISPATAFGLLDQLTQPRVNVRVENVCPQSEWECKYHSTARCDGRVSYDEGAGAGDGSGGAGTPGGPPVEVLSEQVIGDYQTVTFRADEANVATAWLRQNGFVVNQTTSIYMEPYVQQGMVFVAAKLVPGAGVKSIKPLKLRYRSAYPMVPLILTAVAAEPHLTVTSYVYSNEAYRPMGHPVVTIDESRIARDSANRVNYPSVLARTIDEAGGDGFIVEYRGAPVTPTFGGAGGCCDDTYQWDRCGVREDQQCQCPGTMLDATDCAAQPEVLDGVNLLKDLATRHGRLTRLTTRVSAEEMTWDPTFEPDFEAPLDGLLQINGVQASLASCTSAVIDKDEHRLIDAAQACAATYCGTGRCVATASGPACLCEPSFVAQRYTDLDGQDSVTCVPRTPPVDLRANGEQLPDACAGVSCGTGDTCIDRNGVPVCACAAGKAAVAGPKNPNCEDIIIDTNSSGADDYSEALRDLDVCAPAPPMCGPGGWYVRRAEVTNKGVDCGGTQPPLWRTWETPGPSCGGDIFDECAGCDSQTSGDGAPLMVITMSSLVGILVLRRRRRTPRTSR